MGRRASGRHGRTMRWMRDKARPRAPGVCQQCADQDTEAIGRPAGPQARDPIKRLLDTNYCSSIRGYRVAPQCRPGPQVIPDPGLERR